MGETTDGGLYEIFQQDFGSVGSSSFEAARENFIISSAGYAVASLLLQPKDRHNGNLLFDKYDNCLYPMPLLAHIVGIANRFEISSVATKSLNILIVCLFDLSHWQSFFVIVFGLLLIFSFPDFK